MSNSGNVFAGALNIDPFVFEQPLSDRWELLWDPLPLGRVTIEKGESHYTGLQFGLYNLSYDSTLKFYVSGLIGGVRKDFLTRSLSLNENISLKALFNEEGLPVYSAEISIAPNYQLTDTVEVALYPSVRIDSVALDNAALLSPVTHTYVLMPITFWASWSFARHWDWEGAVTFRKFGYQAPIFTGTGYAFEDTLGIGGSMSMTYIW